MSSAEASLGVFEVVAILGALAWLPQLYRIYVENYIKPEIIIISDKTLELGYTTNGPIVNIRLALVSEKRRSLVNKIDLTLTHEHNESHKFSWDWFEETLYQIDLPDASQMPTKKNQNAIAIRIEASDLVEKKIGFNQNTFKEEYKKQTQLVTDDQLHLINSGKDFSDIEKERSYAELNELLKNSFNWKSGKYKVELNVHTSETKKPFVHYIEFELTPLDKKTLDLNIPLCERQIHKNFVNPEEENVPNWYWVYPIQK